MSKIDKAIAFVNDNYGMIDGCRCKTDDKDVVHYILRILNKHKKDVEINNNGKRMIQKRGDLCKQLESKIGH
jgi:hypothetical protein